MTVIVEEYTQAPTYSDAQVEYIEARLAELAELETLMQQRPYEADLDRYEQTLTGRKARNLTLDYYDEEIR